MRKRTAVLLAGFLLCTTGLSGTSIADPRDTILGSCAETLRMNARACACIADKAEANFDAQQMEFFLAIISKNSVHASELQQDMTIRQLKAVGESMTSLPAQCAG